MKKKPICLYIAIAILFLVPACSKVKNVQSGQVAGKSVTTTSFSSQNSLDTLLNVTYESGTTNSGIPGITTTHATAADAAYLVSPGATGTYAIAHKIVQGDSAYYSDANWRSESDAQSVPIACYYPGDERRYEFSVLLKDWPVWNTGDATDESNFFQLKMTNGAPVPLQIRVQRNALRVRYQDSTVNDILTNFQPYVNQWIKFRIDVLWASTATGYMNTYMQLPGQSDFVLVNQKTNYLTYTGTGTEFGYIKWGLYVTPPNVTRIVYHDDIRIINLNQAPTATGLIWGNSIPDANPAYLDGPYTNAPTTTNPANYNNTDQVYKHPYIKYQASQNIVYSNSTSPAPNPADNIVGTPWSDFSRSKLSASGISGSTPGPAGRYLLVGWANAPSASVPSALDTTRYYQFHLDPKAGCYFNFSTLNFTVLRGSSTQPNIFVLRSSADNFAANISTPVTITGTTTPTAISFNASALTNITTGVTFRLYAYGATATSGSMLVGVNDFQVYGQVLPSP